MECTYSYCYRPLCFLVAAPFTTTTPTHIHVPIAVEFNCTQLNTCHTQDGYCFELALLKLGRRQGVECPCSCSAILSCPFLMLVGPIECQMCGRASSCIFLPPRDTHMTPVLMCARGFMWKDAETKVLLPWMCYCGGL